MDIQDILDKNYITDLINIICGHQTELVTRPQSFMVRSTQENDHAVQRIIVLPPRGFTADKINQTNSHDEAESATIKIKGLVRDNKNSFSIVKDCLLVASIPQNGTVSNLNKPYLNFELNSNDNPDLILKKYSAGTAPFTVVKNDGYGFYHNLINLTDDWLVLELYKKLRPQKKVELQEHSKNLSSKQAKLIHNLYQSVLQHGDEIFYKAPKLIELVLKIPPEKSLPSLCNMLFVHDSGRHEACSVFAIILKIGKTYPDLVKLYLKKAIENLTIPAYYAAQLIAKIDKNTVQNPIKKIA